MPYNKNNYLYQIEDLNGRRLLTNQTYKDVLEFCGLEAFSITNGNSRVIKNKYKVIKYNKFGKSFNQSCTKIPQSMWDEYDRIRLLLLKKFK